MWLPPASTAGLPELSEEEEMEEQEEEEGRVVGGRERLGVRGCQLYIIGNQLPSARR